MREDIKILSVDYSEFMCPICSQVFYKPIKTICGHNFCVRCIIQWTKKKKQCPCCRRLYQNATFYQTDEIMAQTVEKLEIACLKCNNWNGQIKELKIHRFDQCTSFQQQNKSIQYQIVEEDPQNPTQAIMEELLSIKSQQNFIKLLEVENEEFWIEAIPIRQKRIKKYQKKKSNKKIKNQEDEDVQLLQEDEIIKLKHSKNYIMKQINKRYYFQNKFLKEMFEKNYKPETKYFFSQLILYRNLFLFHILITKQI
ncbi:unnamed protein product [Paramecium pentaurelia]|uniref:RING-type domain-containing protein n=1 Tax=Paramecium pentaurelia TaxID=43138 RepID=A0A8S1RXP3_9CILI|nr:unnamed protein product [Paramecium pentaurelia]